MSDITEKDVAHLAHLARLKLSEDEVKELYHHFQVILDYVASLDAVPDLKLSAEPRKSRTHLREDEVGESLSADDALANSPKVRKNQFVVPPIIEDME